MNRIIQSYNALRAFLEKSEPYLNRVMKEHTVIVLLKFEHFLFIILRLHPIPNFALVSATDMVASRETIVKVIYEIRDNLMLIPRTCVNFFILRTCTLQETNRIMNYVNGKYMLKRSSGGWKILNYFENVITHMFNEAN